MSPRICDPGGRGLVFPLLESEQGWSPALRAALYCAALTYIFLGVAIVADKFMEGIEMITSKKLRVRNHKTGKIVTVQKWNDTVANLTLLALGSSAPEILLSIMEIGRNKFHAGALGPSTIVGSAAFNLFVIIAVCIYAVPSSEIRAVKEYNVYIITALCSILAYLWLVVVVQVSSPDVVEPWEGCATLAGFPILVIISYCADIGYFKSNKSEKSTAATPLPPKAVSLPAAAKKYAAPEVKPGFICDTSGKVLVNAAGALSFDQDTTEVWGTDRVQVIKVPVTRCNGSEGTVTCKYRMDNRAGTAIPGRDYTDENGTLTFGPGVDKQEIDVEIHFKHSWECSDTFQIILEEPTGGVMFSPHDDGGEGSCILTVQIRNGNAHRDFKLSHKALSVIDKKFNVDRTCLACSMWKDAVAESLSSDVEEGEVVSMMDKLMHVICMPWKFAFAVLIPPSEYMGGWICFTMALVFIGALTALIIDFAELFGCVTGCADSITAITFVAMGTSMPDLFASKTAACQDETADASIVNVTGSNSVNVFMGIGVPWAMASIYWSVVSPTDEWLTKYGAEFLGAYPNGAFIVKGGDLGFSVVAFLIAALIALAILYLRRQHLGGELGGPAGLKAFSSATLLLLWCFYIALSIWKVQNPTAGFSTQLFAIVIAIFVLQNSVLIIGGILKCMGFFDARKMESDERLTALEEGAEPCLYGLAESLTKLPHKSDGLQFDSIELGFDADEDGDSILSLRVAALVCSFVTRLKRRSLKRRELLGCGPPLEVVFRGAHGHPMHMESFDHAGGQGWQTRQPPPLPPPSYSPAEASGSTQQAACGVPLKIKVRENKSLSFAANVFTCLAVVKLRKRMRQGRRLSGSKPHSDRQSPLVRSDSFHSAVEIQSSSTYVQPRGIHIADVLAAGVCVYAAGQLA